MASQKTQSYTHIPVLLNQAINLLDPKSNGRYLDATLGGGGYTKVLLERSAPKGAVLSLDLDLVAIENAKQNFKQEVKSKRLILAHSNFSQIDKVVESHKEFNGFNALDGIVADIGLSSFQLDQSGRGITFQKSETLDMRFDLSSSEPDARFILNNHSEQDLFKIFKDYGEEKESMRIARAIVKAREEKQLHLTTDLTEIIQKALPKPVQHRWTDSARRIFQALRIEVNHELENLETFLPKALDLVKPGGVVAVVSFHSLEDRIVKNFFAEAAKGCICPKDFPICQCGRTPAAEILTRKPITAEEDELKENSRSNPAKLRAIRKL